MLLATGITTMLILQALLNMAVIVAAAPPTGVTLPFISYGGSSLVASLFGIGVLLSISRYGVENGARATEVGRYAYERVDLGRGDGRTRVPRTGSGTAPRGQTRSQSRSQSGARINTRTGVRSGSYQSSVPRASIGDGRVRGSGDGSRGGGG